MAPVTATGLMRVATLNLFGTREDWPRRRQVLVDGFAGLQPDLIALQEVVLAPGYDQARDVLGEGYELLHHGEREADGQGISIASRWPVVDRHEVNLHITGRSNGFACSALVAVVQAPEPLGQVVFVNHLPDWQLTHEAERQQQSAAVAGFLEQLAGERPVHVVVAGDLDATPDSASIRFWTGKQAIDGVSVCYRDAWACVHPGVAGHTFTPDNELTVTGDGGDWALELGRRIDYVLVRCTDHGPTLDILDCRRLFDRPVDGVWGSDHFGVTADLSGLTRSGSPVP